MSRRVDWTNGEVADRVDWTRMGTFASEGDAALASALGGYPSHWSGFTVARKNAQEVTVAPGSYYRLEEVFSHLEATDVDLQPYIPIVAGTTRWVALVVGGAQEQIDER